MSEKNIAMAWLWDGHGLGIFREVLSRGPDSKVWLCAEIGQRGYAS
jgi:hypothetical protein